MLIHLIIRNNLGLERERVFFKINVLKRIAPHQIDGAAQYHTLVVEVVWLRKALNKSPNEMKH